MTNIKKNMLSGFHPSTFSYYCFSIEIEFKLLLGVCRGCCNLWLKQNSKLWKPLEMALFFGCDKRYKYCIITSNIQEFLTLRFQVYTLTIFPLTNLSFMKTRCFQWKKNKLLGSINNYIQGIHMIFNGVNFNWRQIPLT